MFQSCWSGDTIRKTLSLVVEYLEDWRWRISANWLAPLN
jgi:hypothetical protein